MLGNCVISRNHQGDSLLFSPVGEPAEESIWDALLTISSLKKSYLILLCQGAKAHAKLLVIFLMQKTNKNKKTKFHNFLILRRY